jgi:hypothetical protein
MLHGQIAGLTRRNTDRQQSCCADESTFLNGRSIVFADSGRGRAISSPGSGFEPQAYAFSIGLLKASVGIPESNRQQPDAISGALPIELTPHGG